MESIGFGPLFSLINTFTYTYLVKGSGTSGKEYFFLSGAGNIFILRGKKSLILNNFKTKILIKSIIILS